MKDVARITRLEERYTHLQDHVTEQDKVILELSETIDRLRRELATLRTAMDAESDASGSPVDERPPHY